MTGIAMTLSTIYLELDLGIDVAQSLHPRGWYDVSAMSVASESLLGLSIDGDGEGLRL